MPGQALATLPQEPVQPVGQPVPTVYDVAMPWNRQPFDCDTSWHAFRLYLMLPLPRSLQRVGQRTGVTIYVVTHWAQAQGWVDRAAAFDNYVHARFQEELRIYVEESAQQVAERHLSPLCDAIELASIELQKLLAIAHKQEMHGLLRPSEVIALLKEAIKLERLIRGETTERVEVGEYDLSVLSTEEMLAIRSAKERLLAAQRKDKE